jgi:hypothetical protein
VHIEPDATAITRCTFNANPTPIIAPNTTTIDRTVNIAGTALLDKQTPVNEIFG